MLKKNTLTNDSAGLIWDAAISIATADSRGVNGDIFGFEGNDVFVDFLTTLRDAHTSLVCAVEDHSINELVADMVWDAATRIMVANANPYLSDRGLIPALVNRLKNGYLAVMAGSAHWNERKMMMGNARKDLVIVCGDDKDTIISLLRDRTEGFRLSQAEPNILAMLDDDSAAIFEYGEYGVTRIPGSPEAGSTCRGLSMRTMARLDPDLIVIDEIKTPGEARAVVMLAETGHQVFASIHSASEEESLALWDDLTKEFRQLSPEFFQNRVSINWIGTDQQHLQG